MNSLALRKLFLLLATLAALAFAAPVARAQDAEPAGQATAVEASAPKQDDGAASKSFTSSVPRVLDESHMSTAVEIAVLLTVLSLLPAVLITVTSFTRI